MIIHPYIIAFKTKTIILYHFNKPTRSFFCCFPPILNKPRHIPFRFAQRIYDPSPLFSHRIVGSIYIVHFCWMLSESWCNCRVCCVVRMLYIQLELTWAETIGLRCPHVSWIGVMNESSRDGDSDKVSSTNKSKHFVDNWGSIWPAAVSSGTNDRPKSKDTKSKRYAAGVVVSKWDPKSQHTEESSWKTTTHQRRGT